MEVHKAESPLHRLASRPKVLGRRVTPRNRRSHVLFTALRSRAYVLLGASIFQMSADLIGLNKVQINLNASLNLP